MPKILLLAALMAQGLPAATATGEQAPSVRVGYADLDLTQEAGRRTLDRRLQRAVESVCPDDNGIRDTARLAAIRACRAGKMQELAVPRAKALAEADRRTVAAAAR